MEESEPQIGRCVTVGLLQQFREERLETRYAELGGVVPGIMSMSRAVCRRRAVHRGSRAEGERAIVRDFSADSRCTCFNVHYFVLLSLCLTATPGVLATVLIAFASCFRTMSSKSRRLTSSTFEPLLSKLANNPSAFTPEELALSFDHLFNPGSCTEYQIGAFLSLLRASGLEGKPEMMSMAARCMRERAVNIELEMDGGDGWADLVGTGGDGKDTFNVSTTAALVAAGAGVRVCKVCCCIHTLTHKLTTNSVACSTVLERLPQPLALQMFSLHSEYRSRLCHYLAYLRSLPRSNILSSSSSPHCVIQHWLS